MDLEGRLYRMGKPIIALGLWAAIASTWAIIANLGSAFDGETWALTRIAIGLVGIAAAAILFIGHNHGRTGWLAVMAWSVLQVPYYSGLAQENYTKHLIDGFLGASSSTTVNGEVTSAEAMGLNLVGVVLLICAYAVRNRIDLWRRRAGSAPAT